MAINDSGLDISVDEAPKRNKKKKKERNDPPGV